MEQDRGNREELLRLMKGFWDHLNKSQDCWKWGHQGVWKTQKRKTFHSIGGICPSLPKASGVIRKWVDTGFTSWICFWWDFMVEEHWPEPAGLGVSNAGYGQCSVPTAGSLGTPVFWTSGSLSVTWLDSWSSRAQKVSASSSSLWWTQCKQQRNVLMTHEALLLFKSATCKLFLCCQIT